MIDTPNTSPSHDTNADLARAPQFIPAREKTDLFKENHIFRTCAYCRVSTDSDMQLSSFELQTEHYQNLVGKHPNWDLKKIYADEGISGTSLKNRDQFNEMLNACWHGEYDLIVTKSVSRFARNLVDCVSLVRKLKALDPPVGVFFETDNLFTLSEDSELKLSLLATFAQEESVKKSESMIWSLKERFKNERLLVPECYGYSREKDAAGRYLKGAKLQIIEEEAIVVRFIYDAFLAGYPLEAIASILTDSGVPTKSGRDSWSEGSIRYILSNERYCGSVLTWKTFTADIFEHKKRRNRQDRDQYLYRDDHDAIISVDTFEAVQTLLQNKRHHLKGGLPIMHVIDDGVFKGFVPVNHHWVNENPASYFEASNSVESDIRPVRYQRSFFSAFDLAGYQVVRGQFLTRRAECPCLTVTNKRISFNIECIRRFYAVEYIQLLIHPTERKLAIRPCAAKDIHSIRWISDKEHLPASKSLSCPYFASCLYQIMEWDPEYSYRLRGTWIKRGDDEIIVFDIPNALPITVLEQMLPDGIGTQRRRLECIPEEWGDSFGEEFYTFSLQNAFYYLHPHIDWNAYAKGRAVPGRNRITVATEEDLQRDISILQARVGVNHGE